MSAETWNRCNVCGKFIALDEFEAGTATHRLLEPDSDLGVEKWETFHEMCNPEQHDEACACGRCIEPTPSEDSARER